MKKLILLLILCVFTIHSQTYFMNVRMKDGSTNTIPIQDIQKLTFSSITNVSNDQLANIIKTFTLFQNYPNPFNPTTTIEYQLPKAGYVEIKVFNLSGQLIRTVESTHQTQGIHAVLWDAKNNNAQHVASGFYIYQVTFENAVLTKKMLFIK